MPKVVAVQSRMDDVSRMLQARGYQVVSMYEASKPGAQIDAFLYTSYHPDIVTSYNNLTETNNITFTNEAIDNDTTVVMLNVTGLRPDEAVNLLDQRLGRRK